jgi:two-component system, NarL family, nitrate/nitrite response regulator NarL
MAAATRVLLADDHPVYLDGLAAAIERTTDLELVATCTDGAQALDTIRNDAPDVAVLDLSMPRMGARGVLEELAPDGLPCAVLVLSVSLGGEEVHECLSLGASGYVAKDADRSEICDAIRAVAAGRTVVSGEALASMTAELQHRRAAESGLLTPREGEILGLLAAGASAPDIAGRLHLSTATVKTHLHNLYEKLDVSDRAAAVAEGMRRGLIR